MRSYFLIVSLFCVSLWGEVISVSSTNITYSKGQYRGSFSVLKPYNQIFVRFENKTFSSVRLWEEGLEAIYDDMAKKGEVQFDLQPGTNGGRLKALGYPLELFEDLR